MIAHAVGWYFPESVGGSEAYVRGLCRELATLGVDCTVLAPRDGGPEERYRVDDAEVLRYAVTPDDPGVERFIALLQASGADVLHLHSLTTGCGAPHLQAARARGLRTVTTVHVPGALCLRGTMMHLGTQACDGLIADDHCGPCWLEDRGTPYPLARVATTLLTHGGATLAARVPGRAGTAARTLQHVDRKRQEVTAIAAASQRVVAVSSWLADALRSNGVDGDKLVLCRQGVAPVDASRFGSAAPADGPLRVGYFGRADVIKGVDVLVRAVTSRPELDVQLRMYATTSTHAERLELERLKGLAGRDPRVVFVPPVPSAQVREAMRACHVIAVPSRCLETGPLVAMEALAAGVPVLGSALGGLAELIEAEVTGWLLPHDDVTAWASKLAWLSRSRASLLRFGPDQLALSTTAEVARRMLALYESLA